MKEQTFDFLQVNPSPKFSNRELHVNVNEREIKYKWNEKRITYNQTCHKLKKKKILTVTMSLSIKSIRSRLLIPHEKIHLFLTKTKYAQYRYKIMSKLCWSFYSQVASRNNWLSTNQLLTQTLQIITNKKTCPRELRKNETTKIDKIGSKKWTNKTHMQSVNKTQQQGFHVTCSIQWYKLN